MFFFYLCFLSFRRFVALWNSLVYKSSVFPALDGECFMVDHPRFISKYSEVKCTVPSDGKLFYRDLLSVKKSYVHCAFIPPVMETKLLSSEFWRGLWIHLSISAPAHKFILRAGEMWSAFLNARTFTCRHFATNAHAFDVIVQMLNCNLGNKQDIELQLKFWL